MFSGIIKSIGQVRSYDEANHRLTICCPLFTKRGEIGASIAIDGVCLTVCHRDAADNNAIGFDLGTETRAVTTLARKLPGDIVNIEFSLCLGDAMDGHMVQGHVDGLGTLVATMSVSANLILQFKTPRNLLPYMVKKGSIAVNGVSLTINNIDNDTFSVCLAPFTIENTSFKNLEIGASVHIETDIVGRYLYQFATSPNFDNAFAR